MRLKCLNERKTRQIFLTATLMIAGLMQSCSETPSQATLETPPPIPQKTSTPVALPPTIHDIGLTAGCKEGMVRAGEYCIDRFEAYVVELKYGGSEVPHMHSDPVRDIVVKAKNARDVFPQSSINRFKAEEACLNAGKRLCTLHEWKKACMGIQGNKYPYGEEEVIGNCNTKKSHLPQYFFGKNNKRWSMDDMNDPYLNVVKGFLDKTGAYPSCVSTYGTYDMVGGLHEWVSTPVDASMLKSAKHPSKPKNPALVPHVGNGIFMGGFYSSSNQNGEGCNYMTIAHPPVQMDYSIGFRCCMDADKSD